MENKEQITDPYPSVEELKNFEECEFSTKAVHCGQISDPTTNAIIPPIYMSSTYINDTLTSSKGFTYTRINNPNFRILEQQIAALENAKYALVYASGMGAIAAVLAECKCGDCVITFSDCYGGTYQLMRDEYERFGIIIKYLEFGDFDEINFAINNYKPKICIFETPSNPLMQIVDIQKLAILLKQNECLSVLDNTFANPYHQNGLSFGVDIIIHSSTKYIGGHADLIGGCLLTNSENIYKNCYQHRANFGINPSPFDCWLLSRSLKTLHLRSERHSSNALKIAKYLTTKNFIEKVYYPGLEEHENHKIAKKQMKNGFGGMLSVTLKLDIPHILLFTKSFKIIKLAVSLGSVETLVECPFTMSHKLLTPEEREKIGMSDRLLRFSIGIEDADDLIKDFEYAFECVTKSLQSKNIKIQ